MIRLLCSPETEVRFFRPAMVLISSPPDLSDLCLHHLGAGAGMDHPHRHDQVVDLQQFAYRQSLVADLTDQDDGAVPTVVRTGRQIKSSDRNTRYPRARRDGCRAGTLSNCPERRQPVGTQAPRPGDRGRELPASPATQGTRRHEPGAGRPRRSRWRARATRPPPGVVFAF